MACLSDTALEALLFSIQGSSVRMGCQPWMIYEASLPALSRKVGRYCDVSSAENFTRTRDDETLGMTQLSAPYIQQGVQVDVFRSVSLEECSTSWTPLFSAGSKSKYLELLCDFTQPIHHEGHKKAKLDLNSCEYIFIQKETQFMFEWRKMSLEMGNIECKKF